MDMASCCSTGEAAEERVLKKEVVLVSRPQGLPSEENFRVRETELLFARPPPPGCLVLKVLWLSLDPYIREILNEENGLTTVPRYDIGQTITNWSISKVLASSNPDFDEGDCVVALTEVANYILVPAGYSGLRKIDASKAPNIPLTHHLGVLGHPGFTAWVGFNKVTQLHGKEEVYVSAAAGAVGLIAGQLAKLKGCRVVGSSGSDEKVRMLKEVYKFDDAFNYKTEKDMKAALTRCFPDGFDVYFENVGGQTLEAALATIKRKGRIVACGMTSQYNKDFGERDGVRNLMHVVGKSLKVEGFMAWDYGHLWDDFSEELSQLLEEGKINYRMDVLGRGVEEFPRAFVGMLKGENTGKALVLVSDG